MIPTSHKFEAAAAWGISKVSESVPPWLDVAETVTVAVRALPVFDPTFTETVPDNPFILLLVIIDPGFVVVLEDILTLPYVALWVTKVPKFVPEGTTFDEPPLADTCATSA